MPTLRRGPTSSASPRPTRTARSARRPPKRSPSRPVELQGGTLAVGGTTANDAIVIRPVGDTGKLSVTINGVALGTYVCLPASLSMARPATTASSSPRRLSRPPSTGFPPEQDLLRHRPRDPARRRWQRRPEHRGQHGQQRSLRATRQRSADRRLGATC